ncbi:MAG: hypothetical protein N2316_01620 [Spirochaetes bacterium]|nr:hypothetical protein [Spirochaetota bacterium]
MKRAMIVASLCSVFFFLILCSTNYNEMIRKAETTFYGGNYLEAARSLLPRINEKGKDQLLFMMEAGSMLHAGGDYEKSVNVFTHAAKLAQEIAISISKEAAALLLNETTTNYRGEDHERVLIHMYLGLGRMLLGKNEEARVDFKKVNDLLRELVQIGGGAYKQNKMAKYLTAIAFENTADLERDDNDREFAYVEYKQILALDNRLPLVYQDLQRMASYFGDTDLLAQYRRYNQNFLNSIPKDAGEFVVIFESGKGPIKVSRGPLMSERSMANGVRIAIAGLRGAEAAATAAIMVALNKAENPIPKFQKRENRVSHLEIVVNGNNLGRTYLLEDVEETAVKNLEDQYARIVTKVAAGIVTKVAVSIAAGIAAQKLAEQSRQLKGIAGVVGAIAGAGTGAALISQIKPDLRCWHTLPANFQLGRFFLPPGEHDVEISLVGRAGGVVTTLSRKITIEKGKRNIFDLRTVF